MELQETTKTLFGILYLTKFKKIYYSTNKETNEKRVCLVKTETYLFNTKIHSTQITF